MIDIIYAPKENEVFQNSAPIPVKVRSTLGSDYYFTLTILVNGEEYDVQTVSKYNDYDGEIDLQNIIQSVFAEEYQELLETNVEIQENLMKSIELIIHEHHRETSILENTLNLPVFYVVNSHQLQNQIFDSPLSLSSYQKLIKTPVNGLFQIPFFANETIRVKIEKNGTKVYEKEITDAFGIYNFTVNLAELEVQLTDNVSIYVIHNAIAIVLHQLNLIDYTGYETNCIAFKNNYNCWEHLYTFGSKEASNNITRKKAVIDNYTNNTYNVITKPVFKINSGHHNKTYSDIINKALQATETKLLIDNVFINVEVQNKKTTPVVDRKNIYTTTFDLVKNELPSLSNQHQFSQAPTVLSFDVSGIENNVVEILKADFLEQTEITATAILFSKITTNNINIVLDGASTPLQLDIEYDWDLFQKLETTPSGFGNPFDTLKFKLNSLNGLSNTATINLNILDDDPNNQAPLISMPSEAVVYEDKGSTTITATVTDPEGDPFTLLWTQIGGQQITMTNTKTASLTLSSWTAIGDYEFQLTATDNRGNSSTQNIILNVMDYKVNVAVNHNSICVYGGKEGLSISAHIDIENLVEFSKTDTVVPAGIKGKLYGFNINGESILTAQAEEYGYNNGTNRINITDDVSNLNIPLTFPASGEVNIPIEEVFSAQLANGLADDVEKLNLNLRSHLKVTLHSKSGGIEYGKQTAVSAQIIYLNA